MLITIDFPFADMSSRNAMNNSREAIWTMMQTPQK
jgi:hypothetical protein